MDVAAALAAHLGELAGLEVYQRSITSDRGALLFLGREGRERRLAVMSPEPDERFDGEQSDVTVERHRLRLRRCPTDASNAAALRKALPCFAPRPLGLEPSIGCGDRLGLATPGHVRAVRRHSMAPILAQQSVRELERTGRTPVEVLDAATWGALLEGWRNGFGADADHLKTTGDVDRFVDAGFSFFTVDPGDQVDDEADDASEAALRDKVAALPWDALDASESSLGERYLGRRFDLEHEALELDEETLWRAAAKYGRAVAHTAALHRHLDSRMGDRPFELEMSVDETARPTSALDHLFVASELERLGVRWVSLAPRFIGDFEKGVDYRGDLVALEDSFARHAAIARVLGPYKISLHSGSDKFSVYPIAARHAGELVHVKTAGTSYLEALRVIARVEPELFREILAFALAHFDGDRATYHISGRKDRVPAPGETPDAELRAVLEQDDGRQVLHVTFGSVLTEKDGDGFRFRDRLLGALQECENEHSTALEAHFERHLAPFDARGGTDQ